MDSLHDDLCGFALDDMTHDLVYPRSRDVPETHRHVLCDKCKANPKKLCRKCAQVIARLLGGGHADISSSQTDEDSASDASSAFSRENSEGYLVIEEKLDIAPSPSAAWEADLSAGNHTRRSVSPSEADIRAAYAQQVTITTTTTTSCCSNRNRQLCCSSCALERGRILERESRARAAAAEAEKIRVAAEEAQALAREIARFNAFLHERRTHRQWQTDMLQTLSLYPGRKTEFQLRTRSVKTCACHGDPDCRVLIDTEYRAHLVLVEADRVHRVHDGRGIAKWVPLLGKDAERFWVEREMDYLRRRVLQPQDHGEAVGLWRTEVVLGIVWGRLLDARWRVERMQARETKVLPLGWIHTFWSNTDPGSEKKALLLQQRETGRGKLPKLDGAKMKGCLLFERNPCWALLPLLRDGGDVGLVWRWERPLFENDGIWPFGNPFAWLWKVCERRLSGLFWLWKWLASVDEEESGDDGELD
ncbi:hypothetical protein QBC37DRAFT_43898 [Rhypophila decipiens]|uniref:Uncharacterized protein n=1 Tax=Rhypophila decipiens TaxID=261697 RepID=A0AAN7B4R1_9PEZI|nr:hypothetical protein QBC37DRAFT_43898 [Rhypophila decipiens]